MLGKDHPDTLDSRQQSGRRFTKPRKDMRRPSRLLLRALETNERLLGKDHPGTLISVDNLAAIYDSLGRYAEAEPLYQRALEASGACLGPIIPVRSRLRQFRPTLPELGPLCGGRAPFPARAGGPRAHSRPRSSGHASGRSRFGRARFRPGRFRRRRWSMDGAALRAPPSLRCAALRKAALRAKRRPRRSSKATGSGSL